VIAERALLSIWIHDEVDGRIKTLAEIEAEVIVAVINATRSKSAAADALGIGRSTLYRKLAEYNHPTTEGQDDEL